MDTEKLKQSYKEQLIRVGVAPHRAEQALKHLKSEELLLIQEYWSEEIVVSPQTENEIRAFTERGREHESPRRSPVG